jgi:TPR repeat protein
VDQDYREAMVWYRKAADAGSSTAMTDIGLSYENSAGVVQDYAQAMVWHRKAAAAGNANGFLGMGLLYYHGLGVPRDYASAKTLIQRAADAGSTDAKAFLTKLEEELREQTSGAAAGSP